MKDQEKKSETPQLTQSLPDNIELFKNVFKNDASIIFREFENIYVKSFRSCMIFFDGMLNEDTANQSILFPIMNADIKQREHNGTILDTLKNKIICTDKIEKTEKFDDLILAMFDGDAVLLVENSSEALIIGCKGWQERSIEEPGLERVLRGPKEGFTESLITNMTLLRRRLKTPDLKFKFKELGVRSKTKISLCYIDSLINDDILRELESRLDHINIDGVFSSNAVEELIKDSPLSPLKTIGNTERPDVVAAKLLEGRIAVIVDGTPSALTLPYVYMEYFQAADDYYTSFYFATINRFLRCLGEFITTSIPAIYVALITFHQEMIPNELMISIAASRKEVPFPSIIEALALLLVFEIIREASIRMPSPMGQSVSIVGALILGQAAIDARLFSAPMVIISAVAGITGLLNIKLKGASIILRLILLLLSAIMGLYGYIFGVTGALIYLFSMRSFGVPYMLNYGSFHPEDLKDTFVRAPWWYMTFRTKQLAAKNMIRQNTAEMSRK